MISSRKRFLIKCILLFGGLYATGLGLWRLGCAAIFMHESVVIPGVVVDVRERPFEDVGEMLLHGNLPWEGSVAHQPHVRYDYSGVPRVDTTLPDLDNQDYNRYDKVEIRLHPQKPHQRHLNKFKFIWGAPLALFGGGLALLLLWRLMLSRRRRSVSKQIMRRVKDKVAQAAADAVVEQVAPPVRKARSAAKAEPAQLALDLVDSLSEAAPKKRRRTSKPKDPNAPKKPRKKKDPDAPPKKRTRKAKSSPES